MARIGAPAYLRGMWWDKKKIEKPLREQLTEAIAAVEYQIDYNGRTSLVGNQSPTFGPTVTDELVDELARLKEALASLDSDDAQRT
jgi:hypothetical protein